MSHLNAPAYFWLASVLTTYGDKLGPASMVTISDRIAALEAGAGGVDWRAMYRFQTAMRFMDNKPSLTRERAYEMADDEIRGLVAQQKAQEPQDAPKASEAVEVDERMASMIEHGMSGVNWTPQADPAPPARKDHPFILRADHARMVAAKDAETLRWSFIAQAQQQRAEAMAAGIDGLIAKFTAGANSCPDLKASLAVAACADHLIAIRDGLAAQEGAG